MAYGDVIGYVYDGEIVCYNCAHNAPVDEVVLDDDNAILDGQHAPATGERCPNCHEWISDPIMPDDWNLVAYRDLYDAEHDANKYHVHCEWRDCTWGPFDTEQDATHFAARYEEER